jgi:hypothetical protein
MTGRRRQPPAPARLSMTSQRCVTKACPLPWELPPLDVLPRLIPYRSAMKPPPSRSRGYPTPPGQCVFRGAHFHPYAQIQDTGAGITTITIPTISLNVRYIFARRLGLRENGLPHSRFGAELSVGPGLRIPDVFWGCSLADFLITTACVVMLAVNRHSNDNLEQIRRDSTYAHWGATRRPMTPSRWSKLAGAERAERVEIRCAVHWPENDTDRPRVVQVRPSC